MNDVIYLFPVTSNPRLDADVTLVLSTIAKLDGAEWSTPPRRPAAHDEKTFIARHPDGEVVHVYCRQEREFTLLREIHVAAQGRSISFQASITGQPEFDAYDPRGSIRDIASLYRLAPPRAVELLLTSDTNGMKTLAEAVSDLSIRSDDFKKGLDEASSNGTIQTHTSYHPSHWGRNRIRIQTMRSKDYRNLPCHETISSMPKLAFYKEHPGSSLTEMICIDLVDSVTLVPGHEDLVSGMHAAALLERLRAALADSPRPAPEDAS